jgi:hypothetical protein
MEWPTADVPPNKTRFPISHTIENAGDKIWPPLRFRRYLPKTIITRIRSEKGRGVKKVEGKR